MSFLKKVKIFDIDLENLPRQYAGHGSDFSIFRFI